MFVTFLEAIRIASGAPWSIYTFTLLYFWFVWLTKLLYARAYKPVSNSFSGSLSIMIPAYKESQESMEKAVASVLAAAAKLPQEFEILILADKREPEFISWCKQHWPNIQVLTADPGKRAAIRLGIESAKYEFVSVIESDTYADEMVFVEMLKPFADPHVGGVVGDQQIFEPYTSLVHFFNGLTELVKYRVVMPALSVLGAVNILGGRSVIFRRSAVLPLMDGLTGETLWGKKCISGDDGRLTSELQGTGWVTLYQSTALTLTVSPPTWKSLLKQRLRWARNGARRTMKAMFAFKEPLITNYDRFWVWKKPLALYQMVYTWTNSIMFTVIVLLHVQNFQTGEWLIQQHFQDLPPFLLTMVIVSVLWYGSVATRFIRSWPALKETKKLWWIWVILYPGYLIILWVWHVYAIFTMNRQGWLTRKGGAGGFAE